MSAKTPLLEPAPHPQVSPENSNSPSSPGLLWGSGRACLCYTLSYILTSVTQVPDPLSPSYLLQVLGPHGLTCWSWPLAWWWTRGTICLLLLAHPDLSGSAHSSALLHVGSCRGTSIRPLPVLSRLCPAAVQRWIRQTCTHTAVPLFSSLPPSAWEMNFCIKPLQNFYHLFFRAHLK